MASNDDVQIGLGPKLIFAFVVVVALSTSVPFLYAINVLFNNIDREARQRLSADLQVARMAYEQKSDDLSRICAALANDLTIPKVIRSRNIPWIKTWGVNFSANFTDDDFSFLMLTDEKGVTLFHSRAIGMLGSDESMRKTVAAAAMGGKEMRAHSVFTRKEMAKMGFSPSDFPDESMLELQPGLFILVSAPIFEPRDLLSEASGLAKADPFSKVIGTITVGYLLNADKILLQNIKTRTGSDATIYMEKSVVASTALEPPLKPDKLTPDSFDQLVKDGIVKYKQRAELGGYMPLYGPDQENLAVLEVRSSSNTAINARSEAWSKSLIFLSIGLMLAVGLGIFFTVRVTRPIYQLISGTERIGAGDLNHQIEIRERDETGMLARAFNRMTSKLSESMKEIEMSRDQLETYSTQLRKAHQELEAYSQKLENVNQMLLESNKSLQKANEVKDAFVSTVSHELKTPLTNIIGYISMMLYGSFGEFSEEQRDALEVVHRRSKTLKSLISDILSLSQIESGKMVLRKRTLDLKRETKAIEEVFGEAIKQKNINFQINVEEDLPPISADGDRFQQILFNIIGNAMKFTPKNGRIAVSVKKNTLNKEVLFTIEDTGIGIGEEDLKHIFERFFQADNTDQREYSGTGLGMSITKELVELHGGKIWASSRKGYGTVFYFTLPLS